MTREPILTTVPRELYYHEVAYVRRLERDKAALLEALKLVERNISSLVNAYPGRYGRDDWQGTWDACKEAIAKAESAT